ncbi:MAG TPA: proteasome subunit alpha [Pseudonocardiaceae bacterium]|nr:proteasome subunit alpha [Pseudonocardiaceae bacterium]
MTMPFYASVEQIMRDRSELARKGIARGRGVVVLSYSRGVLFVAENLSTALHKISEIYDRIGFAAVGRYNEYENLRQAGIRHADVRGYSYDRRDVTGRGLANAYAQTLGTIFSEQQKPFEVELCVAEVGADQDSDQLYHLTYDGSIVDEPNFVVMGGQAEAISTALKESFRQDMDTAEAVATAVAALSSASSSVNGANKRTLGVGQLEVAVLDRSRPRRAFRRITGSALTTLLSGTDTPPTDPDGSQTLPDQDAEKDGGTAGPSTAD